MALHSHAVGNAKPIADLCQDWSLVKAEQMGGKLTVHISRKLLSSDNMDRNFTDDAAYPLMHTSVIAAWGNSAGIEYHTPSGVCVSVCLSVCRSLCVYVHL